MIVEGVGSPGGGLGVEVRRGGEDEVGGNGETVSPGGEPV